MLFQLKLALKHRGLFDQTQYFGVAALDQVRRVEEKRGRQPDDGNLTEDTIYHLDPRVLFVYSQGRVVHASGPYLVVDVPEGLPAVAGDASQLCAQAERQPGERACQAVGSAAASTLTPIPAPA